MGQAGGRAGCALSRSEPSIHSLTVVEDGAGSEGELRVVLSLAGVECTGLAQGGAAREATEGGHRAPHTPLGGCGARGGLLICWAPPVLPRDSGRLLGMRFHHNEIPAGTA